MTTVLSKELKRMVSVDGKDYTLTVDAKGLRLTAKGKRKADVELCWRDLLSGEAAMAVALRASLSEDPKRADKSTPRQTPGLAHQQVSKNPEG